MKRKWLMALALLASCGGGPPPPEGLLARDKFEHLLLEAELIEARVNHEKVLDKQIDSPVQQYYDSLFAAEGVTEAQFDTTFQYYAERPEELKKIYEEIVEELGKRKDGADQ